MIYHARMLKAYALYPDDTVAQCHSIEAVAEAVRERQARVWIDLEGAQAQDLAPVAELFSLYPDAVEDCLEGGQRARVDDYDDYLFLLMYGALESEALPEFIPRKLCIFFSAQFLITVHAESLSSVRSALHRMERSPELLRQGLEHLLFHIMDGVVDNYVLCAENYEEILESLEQESLIGLPRAELLVDLTRVRRELIGFRRTVVSLRELVTPFARGDYRHISEDLMWDFRHVVDHLTHTWELTEGLREIAYTIRENYANQLAQRTNDHMRTLTIFSTFLLPLSLVSGIYGMNVAIWPDNSSRLSFPLVLLGMAGIAVAMFIYFRKRRWL